MRSKELRVLYVFLILIILTGFGMVWLLRLSSGGLLTALIPKSGTSQEKNKLPVTSSKTSQTVYDYQNLPKRPLANQVFYGDNGFDPKTLAVPKGAIMVFFNMSKTKDLWVIGPGSVQNNPIKYQENVGIWLKDSGKFKFSNKNDPSATVEVTVR